VTVYSFKYCSHNLKYNFVMLRCQIVLLLFNHSLWDSCNCQVEKAYIRHYSNLYICKHLYCTGCYDRTRIRQQKMSDHVKTLHEASGWIWHWPLTSLKTIWGFAPRENGPGGKGVIFMLCWKASLSLSLSVSCTPSGKKHNKSDVILETGESFVLLLLSEVFLCCASQTLKNKFLYLLHHSLSD